MSLLKFDREMLEWSAGSSSPIWQD